MMTWTGSVSVARASRNSVVEPRKRSWAKAYPAIRLTVTVSSDVTSAMATELPSQVSAGKADRTRSKLSSVNERGHSRRPPPSSSARDDSATTTIQ